MTIEARKIKLVQSILNVVSEDKLEQLENLLNEDAEEVLRDKLRIRALRSEEDIKAGRVYTMEEAKVKLNERFGI